MSDDLENGDGWRPTTDVGGLEPAGADYVSRAWADLLGAQEEGAPPLFDAPSAMTQITDTTRGNYKRICHLSVEHPGGKTSGATGFMIAPRTMLTAGHVLMQKLENGRNVMAVRVHVIPGRSGENSIPFGGVTVDDPRAMLVHPEFARLNLKEARDYDWGALILPKNLDVGFFGHALAGSGNPADWHGQQTFGYPSKKPMGTLWRAAGAVKEVGPTAIFYDTFASLGQSGGPVLPASDKVMAIVHAMHIADLGMGKGIALRFTREFENGPLKEWCRLGSP